MISSQLWILFERIPWHLDVLWLEHGFRFYFLPELPRGCRFPGRGFHCHFIAEVSLRGELKWQFVDREVTRDELSKIAEQFRPPFDSILCTPDPTQVNVTFIPKHWFCQRNAKQIENSNFPFDQPRKCTLISWHHSFIALPLHCHPDDSHQYRFGTKQKQNVCLTSPRCVSLVNVNDIGNPSSVSPPII